MGLIGSRAARLGRLSDAISSSKIPLSVVDLADGRLVVINNAAADLFELAPDELIGRPAVSLWDQESIGQGEQAMAALAGGAIDSYRGCRRIRRPSGPLDVWLWTRKLNLGDRAVAVSVMAPVGESDGSGRLIGTYFGPDAIDIAVGTVDRQSRRLGLIRSSSQVVIDLPADGGPGTDLATLVHPDDVDRLLEILGTAGDAAEEQPVKVRLRQDGAGWTEIQCVPLPTPPGEPLRVAFAPSAPIRPDVPDSERLADLERQILRIAAELHAVSDTRRDSGVVERQRPSLDALPPRQREIIVRLLRGERVSTIADAMYLSPSTVRNHLSKVFKTFGVNSQASLLALLRADFEEDAS